MRNCLVIAAVAAAMAVAGGATAAEVEVKMLNRGTEGVMVFEPALVKVEPATPSSSWRPKGAQCGDDQGHAAGRRGDVPRKER